MSHLARLALLAVLVVPAAGCSSTDDLQDAIAAVNPFGESKKTLPGERHEVLTDQAPLQAKNRAVAVGGARQVSAWTGAGGPAGNDAGHASLGGSGTTLVWSTRVGNIGSGSMLREDVRAFARPISASGRVFTMDPTGTVSATSLSGGVSWSTSVRPSDYDNQATTGGIGTDGARVYVGTAWGDIVALDADTGAKVWEKKLPEPARGAPTIANGRIYIVGQSNTVRALSAADGTEAWSFRGVPEMSNLLSSNNPAVAGGVVVVPFTSGEIVALDEKSGQPIWNDSLARASRAFAVSGLSTISASPVISDGIVYATGVGSRTVAVQAKTGQRLWDVAYGSAHTPVVSGNALFLVDLDDNLIALERKSGDLLWSSKLPVTKAKKKRTHWAGPVLAGGSLWLASNEGGLIGVDPTSGRISSNLSDQKPVMIAPITVGGKIILWAADGTLMAYE